MAGLTLTGLGSVQEEIHFCEPGCLHGGPGYHTGRAPQIKGRKLLSCILINLKHLGYELQAYCPFLLPLMFIQE